MSRFPSDAVSEDAPQHDALAGASKHESAIPSLEGVARHAESKPMTPAVFELADVAVAYVGRAGRP